MNNLTKREAYIGSPAQLKAKSISSSAIQLNWKENIAFEKGFKIERAENNDDFIVIGQVEKNSTSYEIIGKEDTPVRKLINYVASKIKMPKSFINYVIEDEKIAGVFCGNDEEAWHQAVQLSSELNIKYVDKRYKSVLSVMPSMYDDIWTGAKGMYKLEPVVAKGGEVIIYAPHIDEISYTHGEILREIGYHVRDYFVEQWDDFKKYPWGILAHSTHLRGMGKYDPETKIEKPRIKVTLATGIPEETCQNINLGYRDPDSINIEDWKDREDEDILLVPHAGEQLYRLEDEK